MLQQANASACSGGRSPIESSSVILPSGGRSGNSWPIAGTRPGGVRVTRFKVPEPAQVVNGLDANSPFAGVSDTPQFRAGW